MQNEELRKIQVDLQMARNRYADLYDFAPVGYFTLDARGIIREVNKTGADILGVDRRALPGRPFSRFLSSAEDCAHAPKSTFKTSSANRRGKSAK